jgi:hypothetical protein
MLFYRLKRLLLERDVLISVIVLGVMVMVADIFSDFEHKTTAAIIRIGCIVALVAIFALDQWFRRQDKLLPIPLMFSEERERQVRRDLFARYLAATNLGKALLIIEASSSVQSDDLAIACDVGKLRVTADNDVWRSVWLELLRDWETQVDRPLGTTQFGMEPRCYHIFPHVALPLAFALGAAVNLRRPIVLYHRQAEKFARVLDLTQPRRVIEAPAVAVPSPTKMPEDFSILGQKQKLILHLAISEEARHKVRFQAHPDHVAADKAALIYPFNFDPGADWLPYVQKLVSEAKPLMDLYAATELCLICPSAIAFALGMAFSRDPRITVCHWLDGSYAPVLSLAEVERRRLPFD